MPKESNRQTSKQAKLLGNVLREHFTLDGSQADLELLRSIADRTYAHTKPGDTSFHAYVAALNDSYCSCYEVTAVDASGVSLWDIVKKQEVPCWNSSGYAGRKGEIWYVRLLPPFIEGSQRSVTISTPYVFRQGSRDPWENYFQRQLATETGAGQSLRDHLKYGKFPGYWLEFVFQAFAGYTGNMIQVTGVPDDPASRPHADAKYKL